MIGVAYLRSDGLLRLTNLRDLRDGSLVSDATVTATLHNASGVQQGGQVSLPAVVGTAGAYEGAVGDDVLAAEEVLQARCTIAWTGLQRYIALPVVVVLDDGQGVKRSELEARVAAAGL